MITKLLSVSSANRKAFATKASQIYKSSHNDSSFRHQIGDSVSNFVCQRVKAVPEFGINSYTFKHKKTGTELWYLQRNDPNKVLSVNFRTTPFDSTGEFFDWWKF
ncbi:PITRM1 family protein [Megaselia abdita]